MKYLPGCTLEGIAREADLATRAVFKALAIDLEELEGWNCCGGMSAGSIDRDAWTQLNRRNLELCDAAGEEVLVGCPICLRNLRDVASGRDAAPPPLVHLGEALCRPEVVDAIRKQIEKEGEGEEAAKEKQKKALEAKLKRLEAQGRRLEDRSMSEDKKAPVREKLRGQESRLKLRSDMLDRECGALEGWRVAAYYGCRYSDGLAASTGGQAGRGPIESVMEAFGGEVVSWRQGDACCGGMLTWACEEALDCTEQILRQARDAGARAIVTVCPLCHYNLDVRQDELTMRRGELFQLPVLHFVEVVAILLGLAQTEFWLKRHMTSAMALIFELDRERASAENAR